LRSPTAHGTVSDHAVGFDARVVDPLEWQRRRALQPRRVGRAVVGQPVVVRTTEGVAQLAVIHRIEAERDHAVEHGDVDTFEVHVLES
jgi:GH25 family lysozyme M1 (1,4-beta-N-acetylmuramidase)